MRISKLIYLSASLVALSAFTSSGHAMQEFKGFKNIKKYSTIAKKDLEKLENKTENFFHNQKRNSSNLKSEKSKKLSNYSNYSKSNNDEITQIPNFSVSFQKIKVPPFKKKLFSNSKAFYSPLLQRSFNPLIIDGVSQRTSTLNYSTQKRSYSTFPPDDVDIPELTDKHRLAYCCKIGKKFCYKTVSSFDTELGLIAKNIITKASKTAPKIPQKNGISSILLDKNKKEAKTVTLGILTTDEHQELEDAWKKHLERLQVDEAIIIKNEGDVRSALINKDKIKSKNYTDRQIKNIEIALNNVNVVSRNHNRLHYDIEYSSVWPYYTIQNKN